jgi:hypothetical protein
MGEPSVHCRRRAGLPPRRTSSATAAGDGTPEPKKPNSQDRDRAELHRDALRDAGAHQIVDGGPAEVVRDSPGATRGDSGFAPRLIEAAVCDSFALLLADL